MNIPLNPQLLGELIEKGYTYVLSDTSNNADETVSITLKPVRQKPELNALPDGYESYHRITQEPMQWACGVDGTEILVDYPTNEDLHATGETIIDDGYFRMSEDFFRQVLESLEDYAVFTTDRNGDVNSWNMGAQKVLGFAEKEIIGVNSAVFFTEEDRQKKQPEIELRKAKEEGRSINERYHIRKDGSRFWGSGVVFPLFDEYGKHHGFTKVMRNQAEENYSKAHGGDQH